MKHLKETLMEICNRDLNKSVLLHDKGYVLMNIWLV